MKSIPLSQGKFAKIDDEDYERVSKHTWTLHNAGYAYTSHPRPSIKRTLMHRFILEVSDPTCEVDHINGDRLDNRRSNLRICTSSQNKANMKKREDNTSGYKGVSYAKKQGKYEAYINKDRVRNRLGYFEKAIDAAIAYNKKAIELYGEFARLNDIGNSN